MIVECPSGLVVELRPMTGQEILLVAQQHDGMVADLVQRFVGGCWVETRATGPYKGMQVGGGRPDLLRLLKGDTSWLYIQLRRISVPDGDKYSWTHGCSSCGEQFEHEVLLADLKLQALPQSSADRLQAGETFEAALPDGRAVRFVLQTLQHDRDIADRIREEIKRQKGRGRSTTLLDTLAAQITDLEGCKTWQDRWKALLKLDLPALGGLQGAMEDADCGFDTDVPVRCPFCGWREDVSVPFGRSFWVLRSRSNRRRGTAEDSPGTPSSFEPSSA